MIKQSRGAFRRTGEPYLLAFLLGFGVMLFTVMPMLVTEKGLFIYYGDYNAQQIPFYSLANDAVRSGQTGWNWFTDLGSDFMASYSFYLYGSPFFRLTTLLPRGLVLYSMPIILAVKHGVASLTAYAYIRRFVKGRPAALTGALLYAFSGFQIYNIFFNHFQDVTALFPLTLIAMEECINCRRRGTFALAVALMAAVNYYFFAGQAVFLVIYYLFRMRCRDFHTSWRKFAGLALEAILGTLIAAFILLPSALAITGNYRVSERLYGLDMLIYSDKTLIPRIIQSFFMPPDPPAHTNLFASEYARWASIGGFLPLFSMSGVAAFMKKRGRHWASRLTVFCIICAFVPILNSLFQAMNSYYYARWFYMPILIMAMMTAQTLDDEEADGIFGVKLSAVVLAAFAVMGALPDKPTNGESHGLFTLPTDPVYFWITAAVAAACLICAYIIFTDKKKGTLKPVFLVFSTAIASIVCVFTTTFYGATSVTGAREYISKAIDYEDEVYEPAGSDNFFRIDISEGCDNYPMIWGLPNMRAFQSVVNTSIMDFYSYIGVHRDVASRAELSHYTIRGLFSVKYYYKEKFEGASYEELLALSQEGLPDMEEDESETKYAVIPDELPGFVYKGETESFEIYENTLYIPMGFAYDSYISRSEADRLTAAQREKLLMKSLILDDEQIERYSDILTRSDRSEVTGLTKEDYAAFCTEKQQSCSDSFSYDSRGFRSEISLEKPQLIFFSVPYSEGWTAKVNGKATDVERVSEGFMAVRAEKGENTIVFSYETPGLKAGIILSISSAIILALYVLIFRRKRGSGDPPDMSHYYDYISCKKSAASQEYCEAARKLRRS